MAENGHGATIELRGLNPPPEDEWRHLRRYVNLGPADLDAMAQTAEILMRRGTEFVAGAYDYLLHFPETAAILGWEQGTDPAHLAERRRFFTIWLARVIGLDLSDDLARYLFKAGKYHAAHGPRRIHTPELYVTGAISLAQASFAGYLAAELTDAALLARALTGWNKLLTMHNYLMSAGYRAARALDEGERAITVTLFGRMRDLAGREKLDVRIGEDGRAGEILRKFFDYYPETRSEVFDAAWEDAYRLDPGGTPWLTTHRIYRARRDWNIRLNGRNVEYIGGLAATVGDGDELSIFPPGR